LLSFVLILTDAKFIEIYYLSFPIFWLDRGCYLVNMQGAAKGGTPMQATPCGLSKQGNVADFPEKSLGQAKKLGNSSY
jgi:hypothetical protein